MQLGTGGAQHGDGGDAVLHASLSQKSGERQVLHVQIPQQVPHPINKNTQDYGMLNILDLLVAKAQILFCIG
jgi:hypothetical protein